MVLSGKGRARKAGVSYEMKIVDLWQEKRTGNTYQVMFD